MTALGGGGLLALKAVANGTNSGLVVVGNPLTTPGSIVVLNGPSQSASLSFDIDGELYGWVVGDIVSNASSESYSPTS